MNKINFMIKQVIFLGTAATILLCSCNMNKSKDADAVITGTDSSLMTKTVTGMDTNTNMMKSDTSIDKTTVPIDSGQSVTTAMAKPDLTKKGKKGKVSILMNDIKSSGDMKMDKEGYYASTEILPSFPGGQKALERFFENNIQYPESAIENGVEGTVNIKFAVDEKGKVYSPKITSNNIGYGIEAEALKVFGKMPTWTPGKIKGKNVKTRYTLPITFQLY